MADKTLKVIREPYDKKGKTLYAYFVEPEVCSKKVRYQLKPIDNGGYALLEILFSGETGVELTAEPYEYTSNEGKILKGLSFKAVSRDEDGTTYECPVRPKVTSSRSVLEAYFT